jgi:hypothetical protein
MSSLVIIPFFKAIGLTMRPCWRGFLVGDLKDLIEETDVETPGMKPTSRP